jgi:ligand-binding sensor domain-containing protein
VCSSDLLVTIDRRGRIGRIRGAIDPWLLHVSTTPGGVWIGSQNGAAWIDRKGQLRAIGDLPDGRAHAIVQHAGSLFIATELGLLQRPMNGIDDSA